MIFSNRSKRAQTSTEYLIILAVVIIIALIAIGVLASFPGIGGSARERGTDAFWQTGEIGIQDFALSQEGDDSFTLKNNGPNSIVINDVRLHTTLSSVSTVAAASIFTVPGTSNQTIAAGNTFRYINSSSSISGLKGSWSNISCDRGESFSVYIEIDYEDVPTGATYTFDGSERAFEGVCGD